jgi:hypothetical protein
VNKQKWQQSQEHLTTMKVHKSTLRGLPEKSEKWPQLIWGEKICKNIKNNYKVIPKTASTFQVAQV